MKTNKIIVIGAGYAGLRAIENLSKNKNNEIILFDKSPYHYMQTEVYDFIANENDFSNITVDLFTFCAGFNNNVTFYKQEITNVDFNNKKVITNIQRYSYDYLIIAVGARTRFFDNIIGLKEYAHGIKALHRALYFKQKFEKSLLGKIEDEGSYCKPINIVITGGGLSGVEIAAQMASFSKEFYKRNHFLCRKLNIMIIEAFSQILNGIDNTLVEQSVQRLQELDVEIRYDSKVIEVKKESVHLSNGEILPMDFMINTAGIEPNALVATLKLEKNERGYIKINDYLQSPISPSVFAIGDCTNISYKDSPVPQTADVAEQMAEHCAKNISNLIKNKPLVKHTIKSRGVLIALGRKYAVAKVFGFNITGYPAYIMKKIIEKMYAKSLDIRSAKGDSKIFKD